MIESLGLVHVYTGGGKGKTTAALGLAVRALEHGLHVCMIQFLKGGTYTGELRAVERYQHFSIWQVGKGSSDEPHYEDFEADDHDRTRALHGLEKVREAYLAGTNIVIMDEINVALQLGHLAISEVESLIRDKPRNCELVLTGRGAPSELIALADYVTEMKAVKHPYNTGILGRPGIDY